MPLVLKMEQFYIFLKIRFNKIKNSSSFEKYWKVRIAKLSSKVWHQFLKQKQKKYNFLIARSLIQLF